MGDLTNNFRRKEFACECGCGFNTVDFELLTALQHYVDRLKNSTKEKVSIVVTCGCRCKKHNEKLRVEFIETKGKSGADTAENSQHQYGIAADIKVFVGGKQLKTKEVAEFFNVNYPHFGIGTYNSFNHIDARSTGAARW